MLEILEKAHQKKHAQGGRNPKLCLKDQLLMALEYNREYRTYFHTAQNYGISESAAYKTIRWVEDTLIEHPDFALPGRKALLSNYETILIDATETPIERPKKTKKILFRKEEKTHPKKPGSCRQKKWQNYLHLLFQWTVSRFQAVSKLHSPHTS